MRKSTFRASWHKRTVLKRCLLLYLVDTMSHLPFQDPPLLESEFLYKRLSKQSPFVIWSRLSIKRSHIRSYNGVNVKNKHTYTWMVLKRLRSHCRTIVETERNVNVLLAATVPSAACCMVSCLSVGVSKAVGMSTGCLGLPLM